MCKAQEQERDVFVEAIKEGQKEKKVDPGHKNKSVVLEETAKVDFGGLVCCKVAQREAISFDFNDAHLKGRGAGRKEQKVTCSCSTFSGFEPVLKTYLSSL